MLRESLFDTAALSQQILAESMKQWRDKEIGWRFDETRRFTVLYNGRTSEEAVAEVRYEPVFGFSPKRVRTTVRLYMRPINDPADLLPESGITLLENGQPFGNEGSWKHNETMYVDNETMEVEYFLED